MSTVAPTCNESCPETGLKGPFDMTSLEDAFRSLLGAGPTLTVRNSQVPSATHGPDSAVCCGEGDWSNSEELCDDEELYEELYEEEQFCEEQVVSEMVCEQLCQEEELYQVQCEELVDEGAIAAGLNPVCQGERVEEQGLSVIEDVVLELGDTDGCGAPWPNDQVPVCFRRRRPHPICPPNQAGAPTVDPTNKAGAKANDEVTTPAGNDLQLLSGPQIVNHADVGTFDGNGYTNLGVWYPIGEVLILHGSVIGGGNPVVHPLLRGLT